MSIRSLNFTILSRKIFRDFNYKFIFYGFYNVFISNLVLQILLLYLSSFQATFISQVVNFLLGYYLYGKKVFKVKNLRINNFFKYLILVICLWNTNWILIEFFHTFEISRNIVALVIIPFLALISYISQKYIVFK